MDWLIFSIRAYVCVCVCTVVVALISVLMVNYMKIMMCLNGESKVEKWNDG